MEIDPPAPNAEAGSSAPPDPPASEAAVAKAPAKKGGEDDGATATAAPTAAAAAPRLERLLAKFHDQIRRIEDLEARVDARAQLTRRRISGLLELPAGQRRFGHRNSHLRLFLTHAVVEKPRDKPDPRLGAVDPTKLPPQQEYNLLVEGKLLVDHLDHESAAEYDRRTGYAPPSDDLDRSKGERDEEDDVRPISFTHFFDAMKVDFEPIYQPKPNPMSKKNKGPPSPLFGAKKTSRRGSAAKSSAPAPQPEIPQAEEEVDPSLLVRGIEQRAEYGWKREETDDAHAWLCRYAQPSPPAHSLMPHSVVARVRLYPRRPADEDVYQASPKLSKALFPHHGPDDGEDDGGGAGSGDAKGGGGDSSQSQQAETLSASGGPGGGIGKKRKAEDISGGDGKPTSSSSASAPTDPPKLETEIRIPQGLTMREIVSAFFVYVRDRRLCRGGGAGSTVGGVDSAKGTVKCDATLKELLGVDRFQFHQLQTLLLGRNLLRSIRDVPVTLVYPMKLDTATSITKITPVPAPAHHVPAPAPAPAAPTASEAAATAAAPADSLPGTAQPPPAAPAPAPRPPPPATTTTRTPPVGDSEHHSLLQLDTDVVVPALFPNRARELLRRVKRRELEHTSSRTKGRYILMARKSKSEDAVKSMIDAAIQKHSLHPDLQPVIMALAKAAPPNTEARMAPHCDLRMSYLLERLREHQDAAQSAWALAGSCMRSAGGGDEKKEPPAAAAKKEK